MNYELTGQLAECQTEFTRLPGDLQNNILSYVLDAFETDPTLFTSTVAAYQAKEYIQRKVEGVYNDRLITQSTANHILALLERAYKRHQTNLTKREA